MRNLIFTIILFALIITSSSFAQDKDYSKISAPDFWKSLNALAEKVKADGSKQFDFGEWQIYFPRTYINFVKKFSKDGGTFEYYVKVDAGGAFAPQIRFKDGPGKSSEAYNDGNGSETKLLLKELDEVISKIIAAHGSTASLN